MKRKRIFISSVQKEFRVERAALRDYLHSDPLLRRFFDVFLFEDLPAVDRRADAVYLDEVTACDLFIGLFGNDYGATDKAGVSPTEREFNQATELGKPRLIYVKGIDDKAKHPKMQALIRRAAPQLIRRRFSDFIELRFAVYASLVDFLARAGSIQTLPFDEQICLNSKIEDINSDSIRRFIREARHVRQFSLSAQTSVQDVLTHLHMIRDGIPTKAAILLFGKDPQNFISSSEIRCMHFHGTAIQRPAPYYRIFSGNLFDQIDQSLDFVLSKINVSVGTRNESAQAPRQTEIPPEVIREAVVNAVAHRDYSQPASIQVSVFSDRLEVWNPGELLSPLTIGQLRIPHPSVTRNTRICDALYLAGYIEKYGTGTLMMIKESVEHDLPEPDFFQRSGEFSATLWRDWLSESVLAGMELNDRQRTVISHLKFTKKMTNAAYRQLTGAIDRTAARDLEDMVKKGLLEKTGKTGRGTSYRLASKPDRNRTNKTSVKPAIKRTNQTSSRKPVRGRVVARKKQQ